MDLFLKTKGLTHFFKVIWYAKSENQCLQAEKWRLIELICMFSRWPPKSYRIYIVVDSLFNVPLEYLWGFCVGLCFIMHLFVFFLFLLTP